METSNFQALPHIVQFLEIGLIKKFEPAVVLDCSDMSEMVSVILILLSNCLLAEAALWVQPHGLRHWASWRNGHHRTHERAGHPAWEHPPEGSCRAGFPWWCQGVHCYLQETRQVRRRMINTQPKQHNQHGEWKPCSMYTMWCLICVFNLLCEILHNIYTIPKNAGNFLVNILPIYSAYTPFHIKYIYIYICIITG